MNFRFTVRLRTDHPQAHNEWWHDGGAVPEAVLVLLLELESTLETLGLRVSRVPRVEAEDEAMHLEPWAARKRKAILQARFASAVEIAKCHARMISRPQHITD